MHFEQQLGRIHHGGIVIDESEGPYVDPLGYLVVISGGLGPRPYPYDPRVTTFGGWGVGAPTVDPLTGELIGDPFPGGAFFADVEPGRFDGYFLAPDGSELHSFSVEKTR